MNKYQDIFSQKLAEDAEARGIKVPAGGQAFRLPEGFQGDIP